MSRPLILYLGPPDMTVEVQRWLPECEVEGAWTEEDLDQRLENCVAVLDASMRMRFTALRIARSPRLRFYVTATTGADHVDAAALAARGIPLLTLQGQRDVLMNLTPAAEHSWLLLMACARRLRGAVQHVLRGGWDRTQHPGIMLLGKTIAIIGCGRIGQWMARYARAFGLHVIGVDPHAHPWPEGIERVTLDAALAIADFISVHVPLNEETCGLIGVEEFARMKRGVIFVNTSRGEIVDETALLQALDSGHVRAAGLDVLTGEPEVEHHPLVAYARSHDNLVLTPHIGGFSPDAVRVVLEFSCRRIRAALEAGPA